MIWDVLLLIGALFGLAEGVLSFRRERLETITSLGRTHVVFVGNPARLMAVITMLCALLIAVNALFVPASLQIIGGTFSLVNIMMLYALGFITAVIIRIANL